MVIAVSAALIMLALSGACAHRLWHARELWQALVFLPIIAVTWTGSLVVREPSDVSALVTFLVGDLSIFVLGVLGMMRMLGGLPPDADDDGWSGHDEDDPVGPAPSGHDGGDACQPHRAGPRRRPPARRRELRRRSTQSSIRPHE